MRRGKKKNVATCGGGGGILGKIAERDFGDSERK